MNRNESVAPPVRPRRLRRWRVVAAVSVILAGVVIAVALYWSGIFDENFHVVTPGMYYRSAQMDEHELRAAIKRYGIKTIINLNGRSNLSWYLDEVKVAQERGVRLVDIGISARQLPRPERMKELLKAFDEGPYPVLVHCWAGADRTGLASAMYRIVVEKDRLKSALKDQLTWRYGHLGLGKEHAMDEFFELYQKTGKGKDFDRWIQEDYPGVYAAQVKLLPGK